MNDEALLREAERLGLIPRGTAGEYYSALRAGRPGRGARGLAKIGARIADFVRNLASRIAGRR